MSLSNCIYILLLGIAHCKAFEGGDAVASLTENNVAMGDCDKQNVYSYLGSDTLGTAGTMTKGLARRICLRSLRMCRVMFGIKCANHFAKIY